ncbi:MAG TPA: mechanosensitive ion channel domain-containing protein [Candidatus Acidoferrales bacterium]|nr:mechanosensitive ion channel domain-containing protein [Candidatus Acidoferrales bacterium]
MAWMTLKRPRWTTSTVLATLVALTIAALVLTRNASTPLPLTRRPQAPAASPLVDESPLTTAQNLAQSATTPDEQAMSQEALRLGDQVVDLNFAAALAAAAQTPGKVTPETVAAQEQVKAAQAKVNADQDVLTSLTRQIAAAKPPAIAALQDQLQLAKSQLELDQDELGDAQRDLARAAGGTQAALEQMLDEHEKSMAHAAPSAPAAGAAVSPPLEGAPLGAVVQPAQRSLLSRVRAWNQFRAEQKSIGQALADTQARVSALTAKHDALEQSIKTTQAKGAGSSAAGGQPSRLASIRQLSQEQQILADYDKRIGAEQELGDVYRRWGAAAQTAGQTAGHRVVRSLLWILLFLLLTLAADHLISRLFLNVQLDLKRLASIRSVLHFTTRGVGTVVTLVVIFGPPSQLATVLALAGAGLTVALKDFIVAFFGWFVLMGRHGMRPGDWVEINGVQGKVMEVGLLHTVILETGNWTGAGHPTGRKVTFVNSFAIEGHYFNFSTAGQWLWDEVRIGLPSGVSPYPIVHALEELVSAETATAANLADQEWKRVMPSAGLRSYSAKAAVSVQPTDSGLVVVVRYIARADDRVALRSKLYRAAFDLLVNHGAPAPAAEDSAGRA